MRDLLVILIIFGSIPVILLKPHFGIIMWTWVSIMNPHRLTWSSTDMPAAMIIGVATIVAWLASREPKRMSWDTLSVIMLCYVLWTGVTTIFAMEPDLANPGWLQFNKSILMVFLTIAIMRTPERMRALIWITVVSVGFFSIKGGLFTIVTGGKNLVWGPDGTAWGDNNTFGIAVLMIIPLMHYLAVTTPNKWIKYGLYGAIPLSLAAVLGTYSRGALLALAAMMVMYWWKAKRKLLIAGLVVTATVFALPLMPQKWFDRMATIETYEQNKSATSRLAIWGFALELGAKKPVLGGGFKVFEGNKAYELLNSDVKRRNIHNIYLEALGQHGVIGFILYLFLGITGLRTCTWIARKTKGLPELFGEWRLAGMLQTGLIPYAVGGMFLNIGTFDLYYLLLALILLTKITVTAKLTANQTSADGVALAGATAASKPARSHRDQQAAPSFLRKNHGDGMAHVKD